MWYREIVKRSKAGNRKRTKKSDECETSLNSEKLLYLVYWYLSFCRLQKKNCQFLFIFSALVWFRLGCLYGCFPLYEVWCFFSLSLSNKPILVWSLEREKNNENFSSSNMHREQQKKVKTINKTHTQTNKIIDCVLVKTQNSNGYVTFFSLCFVLNDCDRGQVERKIEWEGVQI